MLVYTRVGICGNRYIEMSFPLLCYDQSILTPDGSASIKKVLPAITGKGYDGMNIDNGI